MSTTSGKPIIVLAGATGTLGGLITKHLLKQGAQVRALVRNESSPEKIAVLQKQGAEITHVDFQDAASLKSACQGAACVVSALSGLRDVIVGTQTALLHAAVSAGVSRFIPSDFAIDFTKLPYGTNRNLDFRKEFHDILEKAPITATSVLNGMFTELLTGEAPFILFPVNRVLYWQNSDQLMDFTTMDNTAAFTAAAALDETTPRYLRIAGDTLSARGLQEAATRATGKKFKLFRGGNLSRLDFLIKLTRFLTPTSNETYPAWQGMQYMRNMYSGRAKLQPLDNTRYPAIYWTTVQQVLDNR